MCGRFTQYYTWPEIHAWLSVSGPQRNLQPRYNIAPTKTCDVVRQGADGLELVPMRWWLIPSWFKQPIREARPAFNARVETVHQKPTFREAFQRRRCIVPASGFYEWTGPRNDRQGHYFTAADGSPVLAFAGLWDRWHDPESGERIESCTIIVSDATDWMRAYHDRLAIILRADRLTSWLDGTLSHEDLRAAHDVPLQEWPVSRRVNDTHRDRKADDPGLILPI